MTPQPLHPSDTARHGGRAHGRAGRAALVALFAPVVLAACARPATSSDDAELAAIPVVAERWVSPYDGHSDLDTPAYWTDGRLHWVVATAKRTDDLWLYNASTGDRIRRVGGGGDDPGEFDRPNGIAVAGDLVLVVERDNHRVQVLTLPDFEPVGWFGADVLERPYGIALYRADDGALEVYVTDDYGNAIGPPRGTDPEGDFTRRMKHFRVRASGAGGAAAARQAAGAATPRLDATLVRSFGAASGPGALAVVESLQLDEEQGLLLVADEFRLELEAYDLDGRYLDRTVAAGLYRFGDAEGIALYRCGADAGYWILTDQGKTRTVFHVLDRITLEPLGSFRGESTANTDGIDLTQGQVPQVGTGVLFAVHDDGGLSAFAWDDIADVLGLRTGCSP